MSPTTKPPFPIWATAFTILGLAILCTLGTWQLQRLEWKNNLIEELQRAYTQESPPALNIKSTAQNLTYGHIKGRLLPDKAFLLGPPTMQNQTPGLHLIVPLSTQSQTLLINMGWTKNPLDQQPIHHLQDKEITFHGLLKRPIWNMFTPPNHPEQNTWYRLDMQEISTEKNLPNLYPAALIADKSSHKFDAQFFTDAAQNRPTPNNNHLGYAFFWFALATALATIYTLRFLIPPKETKPL